MQTKDEEITSGADCPAKNALRGSPYFISVKNVTNKIKPAIVLNAVERAALINLMDDGFYRDGIIYKCPPPMSNYFALLEYIMHKPFVCTHIVFSSVGDKDSVVVNNSYCIESKTCNGFSVKRNKPTLLDPEESDLDIEFDRFTSLKFDMLPNSEICLVIFPLA